MNSHHLILSVAMALAFAAMPLTATAQTECDYAAWLTANSHYSGANTPVPTDSLDQDPTLTAWPDSDARKSLAEVAGAGWEWEATVQLVLDTNGTVLEAEVLHVDVWAEETDIRGSYAVFDKLASADSVGLVLREFVRGMEFTPGIRNGAPVRTFLCPDMSAAMLPTTERDEMGFTVIGPTFFAIQVHNDSAAADWYHDVLGLRQVNHLAAADGRYSIRNLTGGDLHVELIQLPGAGPAPTQPHLGLFKAGFFVDDIDAAFSWLESQGVDTDARVVIDRELHVLMFVFRDLEGNALQVFQRCGEECGRG